MVGRYVLFFAKEVCCGGQRTTLLFHLFDAGSLVVCYWNNKLSALWASWISLVSCSHTTTKTLELETASITADFLWILRIQTWIFMFMWQVNYPLHHLPSYLTID